MIWCSSCHSMQSYCFILQLKCLKTEIVIWFTVWKNSMTIHNVLKESFSFAIPLSAKHFHFFTTLQFLSGSVLFGVPRNSAVNCLWQTAFNQAKLAFFCLCPQADALFDWALTELRIFQIWHQPSPFQNCLAIPSNGIRHHYLIISNLAAD